MANYIVLNSKFTPYTFQDKIAPYQDYAKLVALAKLTMQQLDMEIAAWEDLLSQNPNDELLKQLYIKYKEATDKAMEYFYNYGLLGDGELKMVDTLKGYRKTIVPMQEAYQRRAADIEELRKAELQDGSIEFSRRAADTALSDYINNSTLSYNFVSKNDLYKQVNDLAKNLADLIRQDPVKYRSILGNQYYESIVNYGFSDEDIQAAINGDSLAPAPLRNIINSVLHSTDLSWANEDQLSRIYSTASSGLWGAKGKDEYNTLANKGYNANPTTETTTYPAVRPRNIYSQVEQDDRINKYDLYKLYIKVNPDGTYELSKEGKEEYYKDVNYVPYTADWLGTPVTGDTNFKKFIDSLTEEYKKTEAYKEKHPDNSAPTREEVLAEMWPSYIETPRYDAKRETEFVYNFDSKDSTDIKNTISGATNGMNLVVVDYNKDTGKYLDTGKTITASDILDDRYVIVDMASSSRGTIIDVVDKEDKGKTLKIRLPQGTHSYAQDDLDRVWNSIDDILKNLSKQNGEKIIYDNREITLTQDVRSILEEDYKTLLANAYIYMGSIFGTNTTKTQEFEQNAF